MPDAEAARLAFAKGHFRDADRLLRGRGLDLGLATEVAYYLGDFTRVSTCAREVLADSRQSPSLKGRVSRVLAAMLREDGHFDEAMSHSRAAIEFLIGTDDVAELALAYAEKLECECDRIAFDASRPSALHTRRAAIRAGDPRAWAIVHTTFGRLEARAGHFDRALRHFGIARRTVESHGDIYLKASLELDESTTRALLCDFSAALAHAQEAANAAEEASWAKGIAGAAANCAQLALCVGDSTRVERYLATASKQRVKSAALELAITDTRGQLALLRGDYPLVEELLQQIDEYTAKVYPWHAISAAQTQIRALLCMRRWAEALELIDRTASCAEASGMTGFLPLLMLRRAFAKRAAGLPVDTSDIPENDRTDWSLTTSAIYWLVRASLTPEPEAARTNLNRANRISAAVGDAATAAEISVLSPPVAQAPIAPPTPESFALMLDVASHAPLLAAETLEIVLGSRCAKAAAVIARGPRGIRVVEAREWDERDALRAARKEDAELVDCGLHRDEMLQVLVQPHDDIETRCTWIAIRKLVSTAVTLDRYRREEKQRAALWPTESLDADPEAIWVSEQSTELLRVARRIATTPLLVLLTGESGTGKEMMARAIHHASDRAGKPFLAFNCTAVPRDMFESQLFGYRKGAFTGAEGAFSGIIRAAEGGTLFLDEIADVPIDIQPKLLRFLESREIQPLGESHPLKVDVRVVAATNINLEKLVADGHFREDLYYRLNVVRLRLPPLRERREEIPALVEHYIRKYGDQQKKGRLTLSDEALEYLLLYPWPGNIRQLANEVNRMVAMAEADTVLTSGHLSQELQASRKTMPASAAPVSQLRIDLDQPLPQAVESLERMMVEAALSKSNGRLEEAARILGISRKGLFLKRRRWGLQQHAS